MWVFPRREAAAQDLVGRITAPAAKYRMALTITGVLLLVGVIGFIRRATLDGFDAPGPWGYYAAVFSYLFMISGAAPLVAVGFRFTKSHWRRPLSRVSELFSVLGVLNVLMFIPLLMVLPPVQNPNMAEGQMEFRRTIWFGGPVGTPYWWDMLGVVGLAVLGLAILWLSAAPDLAAARPGANGFRRKLYALLAGHWYGTKRQWLAQKAGLAMLGAFYFMFLIFVQFIVASEFGMALVPGWKDSIFPPLYTIVSFQSSLATILVIMFILRRWGGYSEYIGVSLFWSASKILFALTMLWTYHLWAFFITFWYGRLAVEQNILKYFLFESYGWVFAVNVIFSFFIPFFILLWNPVRKKAWGPPLAGCFILLGTLAFNIRIFVGSFNAGNGGHTYDFFLETVPPPVWPDLWDICIVVGALGAAAFIYLLAARVVPILSVWEIKEGALYQRMETFMHSRYMVLAKPE
jgi:molybdopterin-containing oxidoreductase family membrane subunit